MIGIMAVGNELTSGMIQDTNSSFIARELGAEGWGVSGAVLVGDDEAGIARMLRCLMAASDAVIVTGGLGPTVDDITTEAVAKAIGRDLFTDTAALAQLKATFEAFNLAWTENNAKQALFPAGADIIKNTVGSAPGFMVIHGDIPVAVIPGVPREAERMLTDGVIPRFRRELGTTGARTVRKTVKTFGLTESALADRLKGLEEAFPQAQIGYYPRFPENHIVITVKGSDAAALDDTLSAAARWIAERLGKYVFGYDDDTLEGVVAALLTERKLTLAVAESLTGGLITDRLTNVPGSSRFFERGVVVYSNHSKEELLSVPHEVLETKGAVSSEAARLMAEGVRTIAKTDIGVATTGIAGPTGGTVEKPVGLVYVAIADERTTWCRQFQFRWERRRIKEITAQVALEFVRRLLVGVDIGDGE